MSDMNKEFMIYDSMLRKKKPFKSLQPGKISLYVCGMTVYDYCHIGHARVIIFFDFVYRFLKSLNYDVKYVRNITDIDDKIIKKAVAEGVSCDEVTKKFIAAMHKDAASLGADSPDLEPKATSYVDNMIEMISRLIQNGLAYVSDSGDVCYAVAKFADYGKLARRDLSALRAGERVAADKSKNDPLDFVLWKLAKPDEPSWESPWGRGRPGWHIECSVMASTLLGRTIDIHGGGVDLQFPHHENEIAQSEGANKQKFVGSWMHVGALQINSEKMSKSLGNFFTIREVLAEFDYEIIRYFMFSTHYRHPIQYTKENLQQAERSLERTYVALRHSGCDMAPIFTGLEYNNFIDALRDDFNTPKALAVMAEQVKKINIEPAGSDSAIRMGSVLLAMGSILGLFSAGVDGYFNLDSADSVEIEGLVKDRELARDEKDWAKADEIRDKLLKEYSVEVEDTADGSIWRRF